MEMGYLSSRHLALSPPQSCNKADTPTRCGDALSLFLQCSKAAPADRSHWNWSFVVRRTQLSNIVLFLEDDPSLPFTIVFKGGLVRRLISHKGILSHHGSIEPLFLNIAEIPGIYFINGSELMYTDCC